MPIPRILGNQRADNKYRSTFNLHQKEFLVYRGERGPFNQLRINCENNCQDGRLYSCLDSIDCKTVNIAPLFYDSPNDNIANPSLTDMSFHQGVADRSLVIT